MKYDNVKLNEDFISFENSTLPLIWQKESKIKATWDFRNLTNWVTKIVTHSGRFHADEIFSVALLMLLRITCMNYEQSDEPVKFDPYSLIGKVIRRPQGLNPDDEEDKVIYKTCVVLDIENGHFDHHHKNQDNCPIDDDINHRFLPTYKERMATILQLWKAIGHCFDLKTDVEIPMNTYDRIWEFLAPISLQDINGPAKFKSPISQIISNINGYTEFDFDFVDPSKFEDYQMAKFSEAVMMAYKILRQQIIREQLFVKSLIEIKEKTDLSLLTNEIGCCRIRQVASGEKEPKVDLEALKFTSFGDTPIYMLINENPSDRDGTFRIIMVDSEKCRFDKSLLTKDVPGKVFIHPDCFMMTFKTLNDLNNFISTCRIETITGLDFDGEKETFVISSSC